MGAVVGPVYYGDAPSLRNMPGYEDNDACREHLILPNGLLLPVSYFTDEGKEALKYPNLRRELGLNGDEAADSVYFLEDLEGAGRCANVYLDMDALATGAAR